MISQLYFHQIIKKFFEPLGKKYRFWTISIFFIIGIALYIRVDIVTAEVVRQNTYPLYMLAAEMLIEHGPDYTEESRKYVDLIEQYYTKHLEKRDYAAMLRILYPSLSPKKALASTKEALEKAADGKEEDAKKAIYRAGVASNKLFILCKKFPRSHHKWFKSEDLPDWLKTDLQQALAESSKMVNELEKVRTLEAAAAPYRANRKANLLLVLARLGYDNKEKIKSFQREVERARDCTQLLAEENAKDKEKQEWLYDVAKSEDRRVKVLEAMLDNNMNKTCELLREATERAIEKEKGNTTE